jgi:hypothetical protein
MLRILLVTTLLYFFVGNPPAPPQSKARPRQHVRCLGLPENVSTPGGCNGR